MNRSVEYDAFDIKQIMKRRRSFHDGFFIAFTETAQTNKLKIRQARSIECAISEEGAATEFGGSDLFALYVWYSRRIPSRLPAESNDVLAFGFI